MFRQFNRHAVFGAAIAGLSLVSACSDSSTSQGSGMLEVQLTDAPFSSDSVSRVDIFVVRVDAKQVSSDSADVSRGTTDDSATVNGWTTIATPKQKIELLALRNGMFTTLGAKSMSAASYQSLRLIIDPSQSSVTLKDGTVLTSTSSPNVTFPSAARTGIKINLGTPIAVTANDTTKALVDFDVSQSFVQRGNAIATHGLLFKPVITVRAK